jgi:trehalose 6-phosphate phosphatase
VSGRPVAFLRERLVPGPGLRRAPRLAGLYGLEWLDDSGELRADPAASGWQETLAALAAEAAAEAPSGVLVEPKGLALTLHWRRQPSAAGFARAFASRATSRGLVVLEGRMSLEFRPPVGPDKAAVVRAWAADRRAVAFLGDDRGDLGAFRAVAQLARRTGAVGVRVAVLSDEAPSELLEEADVVVDGPPGVVGLLEALADAVGA